MAYRPDAQNTGKNMGMAFSPAGQAHHEHPSA